MTMTDDPIPAPPRYPTRKEWEAGVHAARQDTLKGRRRHWPTGTTHTCPSCGVKGAFVGREDLTSHTEANGVAVAFHNLHGGQCTKCHAQALEDYEIILIEDLAPPAFRSDHKARITRLSKRNLGTYWPQDVIRLMGLHPQDDLIVKVLDADTMVLERRHAHD